MLGPISRIRGNSVEFEDGKECSYDSIVFATGYKSTANRWLKVYIYISRVVIKEGIILAFPEQFEGGSH